MDEKSKRTRMMNRIFGLVLLIIMIFYLCPADLKERIEELIDEALEKRGM